MVSGGQVLTSDGWRVLDVAVDSGRVVELATGLSGEEHVDARGCFVGPGLVDLHTHAREPGDVHKEDLRSATRAAAAGGFTSIVVMPNTRPSIDTVGRLAELEAAIADSAVVEVIPAAALTMERAGSESVDIESLHDRGVRMFTDDGDSHADVVLMRQLMERIADLPGAFISQHAEDPRLSAGGHMHAGPLSDSLDIDGLSSEAEWRLVERDIELVRETGARYHCQHVSSAKTVELIRRAKQDALPVTAEVTPHHLIMTVDDVATLDTNLKMYPPLREESDRAALVEALLDGTIDAVATDHAPHAASEKAVRFEAAPRGVIGLETAASVTWEVCKDAQVLFDTLARRPAEMIGKAHDHVEIGATADLVVFDPSSRWTPERFESKSSNSPFLGRELEGRVRATIAAGEVVFREGAMVR